MSRSKFRQSLCHANLDDAVRSRVRGGDEVGIEDCPVRKGRATTGAGEYLPNGYRRMKSFDA